MAAQMPSKHLVPVQIWSIAPVTKQKIMVVMVLKASKEFIYTLLQKINKESDQDWSEIAEEYEVDCSNDSLRKYAKGVQWCDEAGVLTFNNAVAYVTEVVDSESQQRSDMIQARDLRREINEAYRAEARSEALRRAIVEAAQRLPPMEVRLEIPSKDDGTTPKRKLVVPLADCHFGAEWEIKGLKGEVISRYSKEIFCQRMAELGKQVVACAMENDITDIMLLMAGDSLDGMLRASQLMKLRYGVVDATMMFAEYISQWVDGLSKCGLNIEVYNVMGNHTEIRPLGSKKGDFPWENMERIITWFMAERLSSNRRVRVHSECKKHQLMDICGYSVVLGHGDDMKDVANFARDMMLQYQLPLHYFYTGHKHNSESYVGGSTADGNTDVFRIPSICGVDAYANSLQFGGRAGTRLDVFEEGYGIKKQYPIWLNERLPAPSL